MKNCPDKFYDNCKNAVFKCNICKAGFGTSNSKLFYNPIDNDFCLIKHPIEDKKTNKKASKAIKQGLNEESKIVKQWISKTIKSGSVLGDGDIKVGDLNLDVKTRTTTKSFSVSNQEYTTGLKKGYDGWIIVNKDGQRMICLTEDSFLKLSGKLLEDISNL